MTIAISANPGQTITLVVNINDGYSAAAGDGYAATIDQVFLPNGSLAAGFPANMTLFAGTGLFKYNITLSSSLVGTYIVVASYQPSNPGKNYITNEVFMINVGVPIGAGSFVAPG